MKLNTILETQKVLSLCDDNDTKISFGSRAAFNYCEKAFGNYDGTYAYYDHDKLTFTYTNEGNKVIFSQKSDYDFITDLILDHGITNVDDILTHFIFEISDERKDIYQLMLKSYAELVITEYALLDRVEAKENVSNDDKIKVYTKIINIILSVINKLESNENEYFNIGNVQHYINTLEIECNLYIYFKPVEDSNDHNKCKIDIYKDGKLFYTSDVVFNDKYTVYLNLYDFFKSLN